jgi:hypothetical protein
MGWGRTFRTGLHKSKQKIRLTYTHLWSPVYWLKRRGQKRIKVQPIKRNEHSIEWIYAKIKSINQSAYSIISNQQQT